MFYQSHISAHRLCSSFRPHTKQLPGKSAGAFSSVGVRYIHLQSVTDSQTQLHRKKFYSKKCSVNSENSCQTKHVASNTFHLSFILFKRNNYLLKYCNLSTRTGTSFHSFARRLQDTVTNNKIKTETAQTSWFSTSCTDAFDLPYFFDRR